MSWIALLNRSPGARASGFFRASRRAALIIASIAGLLACGGEAIDSGVGAEGVAPPALRDPAPAVVVAFEGVINPYHEYFFRGGPPYRDSAPEAVTEEVRRRFDIGPEQVLRLTRSGNPDADIAADTAQFLAMEPGRFYWVEGTNLILHDPGGAGRFRPIDDDSAPFLPGSGVETPLDSFFVLPTMRNVAAALATHPQLVAVVSASNSTDMARLVRQHPAIDMGAFTEDSDVSPIAVEETAPAVIDAGKLIFSPTEDAQTTRSVFANSVLHGHSGPWWMISVGGFEEAARGGVRPLQAKPYDFVADRMIAVPDCLRCQSGGGVFGSEAKGLAGVAAAVTARVLQEARFRAGHVGGVQQTEAGPMMVAANGVNISNWQLRRALEVAAFIPSATDYDPTNFGPNPPTRAAITPVVPVPDDAPWTLAGWGLLSPDPAKGVVERALGVLGFGAAPPDKPQGFCEYMSAYMEARFTYWDAFPSAQPGRGQINGRDLYIGCESALP